MAIYNFSLYEVLKVQLAKIREANFRPVSNLLLTCFSCDRFLYRVEMRGFEPLTPCLQGRCSPN